MITLLVGGLPVRLREFHDLSFIENYGRVFSVFDEHNCGMLSFGLMSPQGQRIYLKYAGAPVINFPSDPALAVRKLRLALPNYHNLQHPALIRLISAHDSSSGCIGVFEWAEGLPLGPRPEGYSDFRSMPLVDRLRLFDMICDFHARAEAAGLCIAGLSDAHMIFNARTGRLTLSNIDDYLPLPAINTKSRLPGSPLYLPPEGYRKGDAIDETSNVYTLSALSHCFFGDRIDKSKEAWKAPEKLYQVVLRGLNENRSRRQQSTGEFLSDWREAVRSSRLN